MLFVSCPYWGGTVANGTAYSICTAPTPPLVDDGNLLRYDEYFGSSHFSETFAYDTLNRLTAATDTGWARTFGYDQWGNMWLTGSSAGLPLNPNTPTANVYNGNNQRTDLGATAYDAAGNLQMLQPLPSPGLAYDAENRQTTAGAYSYGYDGDGRRVTKTGGGLTELYVYDAMGALTAEYDSGTAVAAPCQTCYLSYDHLGSVRLVTDTNAKVIAKHDYLPFGEEIPASVAGRDGTWGAFNDSMAQKFTGRERDAESGLDYFGARYYGSALGRFTSPDWSAKPQPVPYADFSNPQTLNQYAYVLNNPLAHPDADGHCCDLIIALAQLLSSPPAQKYMTAHPAEMAKVQKVLETSLKVGTGVEKVVAGGATVAISATAEVESVGLATIPVVMGVQGGTATAVSGVVDIVGAFSGKDMSGADKGLSAMSNPVGQLTTLATGSVETGANAAAIGDALTTVSQPTDLLKGSLGEKLVKGALATQSVQEGYNAVKEQVEKKKPEGSN